MNSNAFSLVGNDPSLTNPSVVILIFQSTFPRGERRFTKIGRCSYVDFNPRSHEGNDKRHMKAEYLDVNFNPRSHEGNDRAKPVWRIGRVDFNPRSHEGNDDGIVDAVDLFEISIHVPTRGTTHRLQRIL